MRNLLFAAAGIIAIAAVSQAGTAQAQPFSWTNLYIGGNGGYGWGSGGSANNATTTVIEPVDPTFTGITGTRSINASGPLAGGQFGFNYQFPTTHWVVGIEADVDWSNITGSTSGCDTFSSGIVSSCSNTSGTLQDFGTFRGRVGYAFDNVLLYGTGGFAWGDLSTTSSLTCLSGICPGTSVAFTANTASASTSVAGWSAGAGVEWAFLPNWSVRVEYLHLQFNGIALNYAFTGFIGPPGHFPFTSTVSSTGNLGVDTVRIGLNYLFNSWSPPRPLATK